MRWITLALLPLLAACSALPLDDPSPSLAHPLSGCQPATRAESARVAGRVLPVRVLVIGTYRDSDGAAIVDDSGSESWMVVYAGADRWVPVAKWKIVLNC